MINHFECEGSLVNKVSNLKLEYFQKKISVANVGKLPRVNYIALHVERFQRKYQ